MNVPSCFVPERHEAGILSESGVQPRESGVPVEGDCSIVEGGDGGEHDEREAAREGHVQAETGPGAPRRPPEPGREVVLH